MKLFKLKEEYSRPSQGGPVFYSLVREGQPHEDWYECERDWDPVVRVFLPYKWKPLRGKPYKRLLAGASRPLEFLIITGLVYPTSLEEACHRQSPAFLVIDDI